MAGGGQQHGHDLIVIGASTGGVEAVTRLVAALPAELGAAVLVVIHFPADGTSVLPAILNRAGPLPAAHAEDREPLRAGRIYVARPDFHLLVEPGQLRVVRGPRENGHRPAVDPLFRSAAVAYGPRVVGVILTGALNDGTSGLQAIKERGGVAIVQDPNEAVLPGMPESALRHVEVDQILPLAALAPALVRLTAEPAATGGVPAVSREVDFEVRSAMLDSSALEAPDEARPGTLSGFICPECKGPLWELRDNGLLRYRCRTGHAFTAESMLAEQSEGLEEALWTALNMLEESAQLSGRLAQESHGRGHNHVAARFEEKARAMRARARLVREALLEHRDDKTVDEPSLVRAVGEAEADVRRGQTAADDAALA